MPIAKADILFKLSIASGTVGNSQAQSNVNQSLGGFISTTQAISGTMNDLFDNITGTENAASQSDYRCMFVHNNNPSITLQGAVTWLSAIVPGGALVYIGLDPAGLTPIGYTGSQAAVIPNDTSVPTGVTFSSPTTKGAGLVIGDIPPGYCQAIWVKRIATNSTALNSDGATIAVEGDTSA